MRRTYTPKEKLRLVGEVLLLTADGQSITRACSQVDVPRASYIRWRDRLSILQFESLTQ